MTRKVGVSGEARPAASLPPLMWHNSDFPVRPAKAPKCLKRDTIYVRDPERILIVRDSNRTRAFQTLVRRYFYQVRYGCEVPSCTTPNCYTFRRRATNPPPRRLTAISARAVACYLASRDNPEEALCPNKPLLTPETEDNAIESHHEWEEEGRRAQALHEADATHTLGSTEEKKSAKKIALKEKANSIAEKQKPSPPDDPPGTKRYRKDPRSLTQNLYDTISMQAITSFHLPNPAKWFTSRLAPEGEETKYPILTPSHRPEKHERRERRERRFEGHVHVNRNTSPTSEPTTEQANDVQSASPKSLASLNRTKDKSYESHATKINGHPSSSMKPRRSSSLLTEVDSELSREGKEVSKHFKQSRPLPPMTPHNQILEQANGTPPEVIKERRDRNLKKKERIVYESKAHKSRRDSWNGSKMPQLPSSAKPILTSEQRVRKPRARANQHEAGSQFFYKPLEFIRPPESLSHLTCETIEGLASLLQSHDPCSPQERAWLRKYGLTAGPKTCRTYREAYAFAEQSVFYAFGNADGLLSSFRDSSSVDVDGTNISKKDMCYKKMDRGLRSLMAAHSSLVYKSLWFGIEPLMLPPPELMSPRSPRLKAAMTLPLISSSSPAILSLERTVPPKSYIDDVDAAHMIKICLHALSAALPKVGRNVWLTTRNLRCNGRVVPDFNMNYTHSDLCDPLVCISDALEDELGIRLVRRLVKIISARENYHEMLKNKAFSRSGSFAEDNSQSKMLELVWDHLGRSVETPNPIDGEPPTLFFDGLPVRLEAEPSWSMAAITLEWVRSLLLKEWDGKYEVARSSLAGCCLALLSLLYKRRDSLGLPMEAFYTPWISSRLDPVDMPSKWLHYQETPKAIHILSCSFLFQPGALVKYFRTLNYDKMYESIEASRTALQHMRLLVNLSPNVSGLEMEREMVQRLPVTFNQYLVLLIRRESVLSDAMDQLWRRERRELLRPLKVKMGMDEGEEGLDHGGVQVEFFRVAIAEAFNPAYGIFKTDSVTRMSWFDLGAVEPDYKFELLGILFSLAIFNGINLPVTLPLAFYRKLLGLQVNSLEHIQDGWPDLAKGLTELLEWSEGEVADIFMRTYEFSFESYGRVVNIDMRWDGPTDAAPVSLYTKSKGKEKAVDEAQNSDGTLTKPPGGQNGGSPASTTIKSPNSKRPEPVMVTNENRKQYVEDYVVWLTDKSLDGRFESFKRGFFVCIDAKALSLFTPANLKAIVEGSISIDSHALQHYATYDGYTANSRAIQWFWEIVHDYTNAQKAQLLQFVTSTERVPVTGISGLTFVIQRNGTYDGLLPTSATCFSRLLLPDYSSKELLEARLRVALQYSLGFGRQ